MNQSEAQFSTLAMLRWQFMTHNMFRGKTGDPLSDAFFQDASLSVFLMKTILKTSELYFRITGADENAYRERNH